MIWADIHNLVCQAKAGDREAWERLHALVQPFLSELAGQILGPGWPERSAQDLLQGTWIKALENLATFRGGEDDAATSALLRAWLRRIMNNMHANAVRAGLAGKRKSPPAAHAATRAADVDVPADDPTPSHDLRTAEQKQRIEEALAALPDELDREILRRHFFQDASLTGIATAIGVSLDKVRTRYHRSLARLRPKLESLR